VIWRAQTVFSKVVRFPRPSYIETWLFRFFLMYCISSKFKKAPLYGGTLEARKSQGTATGIQFFRYIELKNFFEVTGLKKCQVLYDLGRGRKGCGNGQIR
jgi:hypothetical protein